MIGVLVDMILITNLLNLETECLPHKKKYLIH